MLAEKTELLVETCGDGAVGKEMQWNEESFEKKLRGDVGDRDDAPEDLGGGGKEVEEEENGNEEQHLKFDKRV